MTEAYDVFISYAHADNEIPLNASIDTGWIGVLAANLNTGPNVLKKRIFIDYQLKPGDEFSDTLISKVKSSTLLVIFLSQNYAKSDWCGKELAHFIQAHSNNPEKPVDVFVVELFPYEQLTGLPENIQNIRKHNIHAKFWVQPIDGSVPILAGYPTPNDNDDKVRIHYWNSLNSLRSAIDARLSHETDHGAANHTKATIKTATAESDHREAVTHPAPFCSRMSPTTWSPNAMKSNWRWKRRNFWCCRMATVLAYR